MSAPTAMYTQHNIVETVAHETVEISGLDTLAEISTNEANKNGAGRIEIQGVSRAPTINLGNTVVQLQRPMTVATPPQQPQQQVVTLTPEQLDALKKSGNVIYVVR